MPPLLVYGEPVEWLHFCFIIASMRNIFSNTLFVVQEGPELSGKSEAVARLGKVIEYSLPTLTRTLNIPINFKRIREPGGSPKGDRGRAFVLNILGLQQIAQTELSDATKAELFTWARWGLYDDLVPETENSEGINIYLGDRSYLSMMVLQGEWNDRPTGVPLAELEESAFWATKGLFPDAVFLRRFPEADLSENISFRQLMILLTGREIMPQDLTHFHEFMRVQNLFDNLAIRYKNSVSFHSINAVEEPLASTKQEIQLFAKNIETKFPSIHAQNVLPILFSSYESLIKNGDMKDVQSLLEEQKKVRVILETQGISAEQVMNRYRLGDMSFFEQVKKVYERSTEANLPRQARK